MQRDLTQVPGSGHALTGIALALGKCKMLCLLTVKTTRSNNMGLIAEAVGDAPLRMGYLNSPSPHPVAYRRGCGQFAGKPLACLRWRR
jgi:hypothetical protein